MCRFRFANRRILWRGWEAFHGTMERTELTLRLDGICEFVAHVSRTCRHELTGRRAGQRGELSVSTSRFCPWLRYAIPNWKALVALLAPCSAFASKPPFSFEIHL